MEKLTKQQLEAEKVSMLKQAEEAHRKWLGALATAEFIDYQLKTFELPDEPPKEEAKG